MAVGQQVLRGSLDVPALLAVEDRLERRRVDAGRVHAGLLRDVLDLHARHLASGMPLSTVPQVALLLHCSEWRAARLLREAEELAELPDALESLEWGLLTPEQSWVVVTQLQPLEAPARAVVWRRLQERLPAGALPPARLTELLRGWVVEADREGAEQRRREAEQGRTVEYRRRRDDGLVDLFALGFRAPVAQAILWRVQERSAPFGSTDERTADQRRFDALQDMLLGRAPLPANPLCEVAGGHLHDQAPCGCRTGQPAPCGADIQVFVSHGGALGTTDEAAELVGHGPLERDQLDDLLRNGARLTPVFTGPDGVPVAVGNRVHLPRGATAAEVREALLRLTEQPPPAVHPRDPQDHPPPTPCRGSPPSRPRPPVLPMATGHPPGQTGPYKVRGPLRRLLFARAPRCEFPGCGARAVRCDAEHDVAWPDGPTCACNLGPCCRRHHRVKQEGWTKTRITDGVLWTSPSGRQQLSPQQHQAPAPAVRDLPHLPGPDPLDELSPLALEHELWWLAECRDDPAGLELRAVDVEPEDLGPQLPEDTAWSLDLQDPYGWLDLLPP